jgi:hypothetical protein
VLETSAGRYQSFYLFDKPQSPKIIAPLPNRLKECVGCDHGTADVNHVWRIPGTLNWPNAKKISEGRPPEPQLVRVVEPWNGTTIQLDDLAAALCSPAFPSNTGPPAGGPSDSTASDSALPTAEAIWEVIESLPAPLRQRLSEPTEDRSKALFGVVNELAKLGHDHGTIVGVLLRYPEGPASKHRTREDLDRDVGRILSKMFKSDSGQDDSGPTATDQDTEDSHASPPVPGLYINKADLPRAAERLRDLFAASGRFYDRGGPVKIVPDPISGQGVAKRLGVHAVVVEAHRVCRPYSVTTKEAQPTTLPDRVAKLYLSMSGEYRLPVLNGITSAPILFDDGAIHFEKGYEKQTGLWCEGIASAEPDAPYDPYALCHPTPTLRDAESALQRIRQMFRTFPFADSPRILIADLKGSECIGSTGIIGGLTSNSLGELSSIEVVDIDQPPALDESAFLCSLLTAVCRPSLSLAPGSIIRAPQTSGSGTGKGLLVRAISLVAFGRRPEATPSAEKDELEKRIESTLISGSPVVFVDNVNSTALRSTTLASAITERPARIRVFGRLELVDINPSAFVVVTGNGLTVSEDLARRFIFCGLDSRMEDPESRPFSAGFLDIVSARRIALLTDVLTIWRWARQNRTSLVCGRSFGSFETWADWVRDPLLTLGCADPVNRIDEVKASDPRRRREAEILTNWFEVHGERPMKAADLDDSVRSLIDPQGRGRQFIVTVLNRMIGTRLSGLTLSAQRGAGKWSIATYAVSIADKNAYISSSPSKPSTPSGIATEQANTAFDPEAFLNAEIGP